MSNFPKLWMVFLFTSLGLFTTGAAAANEVTDFLSIDTENSEEVSNAVQIIIYITLLSLAPGLLIVLTSFTRIIVVLSIIRQALGMQQTPPNVVLISLALFLTIFSMMPVIESVNEVAYQPYLANNISFEKAIETGSDPVKRFMVSQTREQDLALFLELTDTDFPETIEGIPFASLIPAFMISELITAFTIGFIIFLPFLLIDLVVASILMSMGMLMVPPMMISLPIKILLFVLMDGWNLIIRSLMSSF